MSKSLNRLIYLIDGVQVNPRVYNRRKLWGENSTSVFLVIVEKRSDPINN